MRPNRIAYLKGIIKPCRGCTGGSLILLSTKLPAKGEIIVLAELVVDPGCENVISIRG